MLASGPALLTALALLQADAEFSAGARFESRAGEAPSFATGGQAEDFQIIVAAVPSFSVRLLDEVNDLNASSATRIFWRPKPFLDRRPLFMEALEVSHVVRPSKRSTWQYNLRGTYGEEDYTALAQQLANQATLPRQITMLSLSASTSASWRSSRRTTLLFQLTGGHRRSMDSSVETTGGLIISFPSQTFASAAPGMRYQLARRTSVEILAALADTDVRDIATIRAAGENSTTPPASSLAAFNVLTVQPQAAVTHDLTRYHRMRITAGLTYANALKELNGQKLDPIYPLLQFDLESLLDSSRGGAVWRSTLSTGTMWYMDPVLGLGAWRAFLRAGVSVQLSRAWLFGARTTFTTDITNLQEKTRTSVSQNGIELDETMISLDLPIRYQSSSRLAAEFGASFAERGPYLDSSFGFRRNSRELWLFLNLIGVTTPTRAAPPRL